INEQQYQHSAPDHRTCGRLFRWGSVADDKTDAGRAAAADVEGCDARGALDLILAGGPGDLLVGVEHLAGAGRANRMTGADQSTARVDGQLAAHLDGAVFDRLP